MTQDPATPAVRLRPGRAATPTADLGGTSGARGRRRAEPRSARGSC